MWVEKAYPLPNFNGTTVEVWEYISYFIQHFTDYVSSLGLKLIHVSKRGSLIFSCHFCLFDYRCYLTYRQTSNIRRALVGNNIVDQSDVIGASPVGAAPTTSSFSA